MPVEGGATGGGTSGMFGIPWINTGVYELTFLGRFNLLTISLYYKVLVFDNRIL